MREQLLGHVTVTEDSETLHENPPAWQAAMTILSLCSYFDTGLPGILNSMASIEIFYP